MKYRVGELVRVSGRYGRYVVKRAGVAWPGEVPDPADPLYVVQFDYGKTLDPAAQKPVIVLHERAILGRVSGRSSTVERERDSLTGIVVELPQQAAERRSQDVE